MVWIITDYPGCSIVYNSTQTLFIFGIDVFKTTHIVLLAARGLLPVADTWFDPTSA